MTAAATRPRRDNAGPAATGATQKSLRAFFKPAAALNQAVARRQERCGAKGKGPCASGTANVSQLSEQLRRSSASLARRDRQRMITMVCHDP